MMKTDIPIQRIRAALQLSFIADALAMPVHWFYNPLHILAAFPGGISQFEAAPKFHPSSIMNLHSTSGGGRANLAKNSAQIQVVGDVILKGKQHYWGIPNQHYHRGLAAGENTLNAHCARLVIRSLAQNAGAYDARIFLNNYINFMTAETPQHPDTYAESYHRGFFANFAKGIAPDKCAAKTHDTASVGGLVTLAPIVFSELLSGKSLAQVQSICRQHLFLTHPDERLATICDHYVSLLQELLLREDEPAADIILRRAKQSAGMNPAELAKIYADDNQVIGGAFSRACYIDDAWPSLLYLAWKYCDSPFDALCKNANLGGDNCHRGMIIGCILGLASGDSLDDCFVQLTNSKMMSEEINSLINRN